MNLRRLFSLLALLALALNASAHAPFDCSLRAIIHADAVELILTTGTSLGEEFLRPASLNPAQLSAGHPLQINPAMETNFFRLSADTKTLTPREADVITDSLDFQFHFDYPLAPAKTVHLQTLFLPALHSTRAAPLAVTDENGNILATAVLAPGKDAADILLPLTLFPTNAFTADTNLATVPATTSANQRPSFSEFVRLGISHILNLDAFDHLLFLTALLLGCRRLKPMLLVITGFTIAHSITLALAALNLVTISSRLVEPAIAASIIFVAAENFRRTAEKRTEIGGSKLKDGTAVSGHPPSSILHPRSPDAVRYALTCGFGLIHGFGFASALRASGLGGTGSEIAGPLVAFNLGVEIGQITVAAILLPLLLLLNRFPWFARNGKRVISALVILIATYWLWQRIMS